MHTIHGITRRCCAVLFASLALGASSAPAQSSLIAEPVPGLDGIANASIRQITRDGTRIVVGGNVLDTRTGATLFAVPASSTLSPDGAFLAYAAYAAGSIVRTRNLVTGEEQHAFSTATPDIRVQAVSEGAILVGAYDPLIPGYSRFAVGGAGEPLRTFAAACPPGTFPRADCTREPLTMTGDGAHVAFKRGWFLTVDTIAHYELMVGDVAAARSSTLAITHPELGPELHPPLPWPDVKISGDGHWIGLTGRTRSGDEPRAALVHRLTGQTVLVAAALGRTYFHDVSDDARFVLLTGEYSPVTGQHVRVVDRLTGLVTHVLAPLDTPLGRYRVLSAHLSGDGSTIVATLGDGNTSDPTPQRTYVARLDADRDGMHDAWEATFGLDPSSPADAVLDPDNDGASSAEEYAAGTHPNGTPVRHFAEGADGAFFATSVALHNPSTTPVTANLRFLGPDGATASRPVTVPAEGPAYVEVTQLGLPFSEFSIVVESPVLLAAERRMSWDRTRRYGSHASNGVAAPSRTWHFAEGATIAGLQTFFLLQNPGATPATVLMRYLLANGTTELRPHVVPPASRLTVWANQEGGPMGAAEFSTIVDADVPIVAERAMYRDASGEVFAAGSVAAGTPSPARSFLFAEGATGSFFDTYLLISNPADTPASVTVTYQRPFNPGDWSANVPITRSHIVAAHSRLTIWVAHEAPELRDTAVSAWVSSIDPIVAERAMWWPGPTSDTWRGSHAEMGANRGAWSWIAPDLMVANDPASSDTFLLMSTHFAPAPAEVRVSLSCADGTRAAHQFTVPYGASRTTLWLRQEFPEAVGRRCAATIESLPVYQIEGYPGSTVLRPVDIVVESAVYGGSFASGTAVLATPMPYPE